MLTYCGEDISENIAKAYPFVACDAQIVSTITAVSTMDTSTRQSILDGKQIRGSYEDPVGGTLTSVTIKLVKDACRQTTEIGRPIMHGFVLSTVRLVGKIIRQQDSGNSIDFDFTDFTGSINCIIWDCEDNDLSLKILRIIRNYNDDPSLQDIMSRESISSTTQTDTSSKIVFDNVLYFIQQATPTNSKGVSLSFIMEASLGSEEDVRNSLEPYTTLSAHWNIAQSEIFASLLLGYTHQDIRRCCFIAIITTMASQSRPYASGNYRLECRFSPRLARDMLAELSEKQKDVVKQIGFGSVLRFPFYRRVHRKFYAWLLASLDTERMILQAGCGREIPVTAESVRRILALPLGDLPVTSNDCNEAKIEVSRMMGIKRTPKMLFSLCNRIHLLRTRYCLDDKEKDQFICSFVSIVVWYFLSPRNKNDGFEPNIFGAIRNPINVSHFNWCQFVVDEIKRSSIIVKNALREGTTSINLFGCVMFLQALYFDSLPLAQNFSIGLSEPIVADYTDDVISSIMKMQNTNVVLKNFSEFSLLMGKSDYKYSYPSNTSKKRSRRKLHNDRGVIDSIMRHLMEQGLPPSQALNTSFVAN
ncbi:hypothetical protein ACP70R_036647 [Stipagrostis hirtigluma subsp. patula]